VGDARLMPVAVITAAAHRAGKRIVEHLVDDGWDLAFWGMAAMRSRAAWVETRGRRTSIARGNILDPVSVRFMVATLRETYDAVDAVVHVAADHLAFAADGSDPATNALVGLGAVKVAYVVEPSVDMESTVGWCAARQVEAHLIDGDDKVHNIAPAVAAA
jgi:NAD(P)-dependent dehydrogenase (short-subunit alcohol dehydrogenase family)